MLQKSTQWFVDRMAERVLPAVGSFMAAALQRLLILGHAEHHNQLEEQARRYEQDGKPHLAALIRREAESLSLDEPLPSSPEIVERITATTTSPLVGGNQALSLEAPQSTPKSKRSGRRQRRDNADKADADIDGGQL